LFSEFLKTDGKLIISGLLLSDEPKMLKEYQKAGFVLIQKKAIKGWLLLVLELRHKKVENEKH
jgi:ribosomal protein L11 methylase PrmA